MKLIARTACVAACALLLSSCATIVGGKYQNVSVDTKASDQSSIAAQCTLSNDRGTVSVTTPGTARVRRSDGALDVSCQKDGAQIGQQTYHASTRGMVWGNLLFGGLIGIVVDFTNGAAHHYPDHLSVTSYNKHYDAAAMAGGAPATMGSGSAAASVPAAAGDLASLDRRIAPATFNAAQNVAAARQCDRALHVVMADGARSLLEANCPGAEPVHIECDGDKCVAVHKD
ncbi:hypothetical protein [Dyella sp. SG609]|uniref:hypothetical protein n=1 Tax=Dyella sp. SG609 TaxID=2587018 RepID=UPI001447FE13|nr:hypothetical protein [Dyella sp. SG609]NKJ23243.1 hypothetical protein [Dyella sp. SG609]